VAMSEEEWLRCGETNPMFVAMELPSEQQLAEFNLACCRRIRKLITDDVTLQALDALENAPDHATVPAELAIAANGVPFGYYPPTSPLYNPSRSFNAAKAVAHAVCRSLPPGSFHYWTDGLENARLVALYCMWAVGREAEAGSEDEGCDEAADEAEIGVGWLRGRAEQIESAALCDLIRRFFTQRTE
jgi:hypothetical protein